MEIPTSDMEAIFRYEYRLTFWQAQCNSIGAFLIQIVLLFIVLSLGYLMWMAIEVEYFIGAAIVGTAIPVLSLAFFGYGRWTRSIIYISFGKDGLATNYGGIDRGSDGIPYGFSRVERGLAGASVIQSITGHFIVVPKRVLEKNEIERLIRERQAGTQ